MSIFGSSTRKPLHVLGERANSDRAAEEGFSVFPIPVQYALSFIRGNENVYVRVCQFKNDISSFRVLVVSLLID